MSADKTPNNNYISVCQTKIRKLERERKTHSKFSPIKKCSSRHVAHYFFQCYAMMIILDRHDTEYNVYLIIDIFYNVWDLTVNLINKTFTRIQGNSLCWFLNERKDLIQLKKKGITVSHLLPNAKRTQLTHSLKHTDV